MTNTTATRNTITGGGTEILLTEATENLIYANTVTENRLNGIELLNSNENSIDENTSGDNGEHGVSLSSSNDNSVTNNSLADNEIGPCFVADSTENTFEDNDPECEATNNGMTEPPENNGDGRPGIGSRDGIGS